MNIDEITPIEMIGIATLLGYSFRFFKRAAHPTSRHSVRVQGPGDGDGWVAHKADGMTNDWIYALLEEAGIINVLEKI